MKMFKSFLTDEDGAITVDFVVLTAAICLMGFFAITSFAGSAQNLANDSASFMRDQCVNLDCN